MNSYNENEEKLSLFENWTFDYESKYYHKDKKIRKLFDESIRIFKLLQVISSKLLFFAHFVFTSFKKFSYDQRFKIT